MSSTPWTPAIPASAAKKNKTSVISDTGTNLNALDKTKHKIVVATSTASTYILDHVYLFANDGVTKIDLTAVANHTHTSTAGDGGDLNGIFSNNVKYFDLNLTKTDDVKKAQWIETTTSTGTIEDNTDGTTGERATRLRSNATSGATSTISYPHLKADWSKNMFYMTKLRMETFSSIALHSGVGADDTSAADSNTKKIQAELCTTTNNNYWLRTATGAANSASDSGVAGTTSRVGITLKYYVTSCDMWIGGSNVLQKSTNMPASGATADNNLIKHSVKNSTAADRTLLCYGSRLQYIVSDTWL